MVEYQLTGEISVTCWDIGGHTWTIGGKLVKSAGVMVELVQYWWNLVEYCWNWWNIGGILVESWVYGKTCWHIEITA